MLQVLVLIVLVFVAADISRRVYLAREAFARLQQPLSIAWLVWLYPLPFLLPLFAKSFFAFVLFRVPLGLLFFVPGLLCARATYKCLDVSVPFDVGPARAAADMAVLTGILGMMAAFALTLLTWFLDWARSPGT